MEKTFLVLFPIVFCTGCLALTLFAESAKAEDDGMEQRIKAIADMLAERPAGFGRPINDREAWEGLAKNNAFQKVIRRAEKYLTEPIPESPDDLYLDFSRTGNRTRWQSVSGRRRGRVGWLVLAECLENKGRFLGAFEGLVRALSAERTWVMPAHDRGLANFKGKGIDIDLGSASLAWNLATADFLLADKLSFETRKLIGDNIRRRIFDPYRDMASGKRRPNWWMKTTNNWNAVCLGGVTGSALALVESREERAFFVAAAEKYSKNFLKGFTEDGYCSEGLGYWNYGFGYYVMLAEAIHQATGGGADLMGRESVREPAAFGARIEIINGVYPAFADCSVKARPSAQLMNFVSRRFRLGLRRWEKNEMASAGGALYQAMMYSFPNSASRTPPASESAGPGIRSWFDKAGVLICRPGEDAKCRLGVALKGGHNAEHHNHNDVGSYVVVVGEQAVLADPGGEVYTARTFSGKRYESKVLNSYGHPVPVVAGKLQQTGRQAHGRVVQTEFTDLTDRLTLDIASAYKTPELKKLERTFVYSRKGAGSLTVTDSVAFSSPKSFGAALITFGRWKKLSPDSLMIYDVEEAVRADIKVSDGDFEIQADEIENPGRQSPTRLGINLKKPVTEAVVAVTITPMDFPGSQGGGKLLRNGGFEYEIWGWSIPKSGMGSLSDEQASNGKYSLKIVDTDTKIGSNISSTRVPVGDAESFELRGKVFPVSGDGVGIYVKYLDEERRALNKTDSRGYIPSLISLGGSSRKWETFAHRFDAPRGTAFLQIWIHSYNGAKVEAYLDDLEIVPIGSDR